MVVSDKLYNADPLKFDDCTYHMHKDFVLTMLITAVIKLLPRLEFRFCFSQLKLSNC